jgi:hypothetical protein
MKPLESTRTFAPWSLGPSAVAVETTVGAALWPEDAELAEEPQPPSSRTAMSAIAVSRGNLHPAAPYPFGANLRSSPWARAVA